MSGYLEIGRGHVWPWLCDQAGHMNVHHYLGLVADGSFHMRQRLGIPTQPQGELNFVAGAAHLRFLREMRSGEIYVIEAGITEIGARRFELQAEFLNAGTGEIAAHIACDNVCFDTATRRAAPMPDDWRGRLEAMRVEPRTALRPASTGIDVPAVATPAAPFETARLATHPWHCDQFGHVNVRFYLEWARGTAGFMWQALGLPWPELYAQGYSTAALEQTVQFRRELNAGEPVVIESGVLETTEKTLRFGHRLTNAGTGETAALVDVRACMIDRHARKATALPAGLREAAEAKRIAWPPAG